MIYDRDADEVRLQDDHEERRDKEGAAGQATERLPLPELRPALQSGDVPGVQEGPHSAGKIKKPKKCRYKCLFCDDAADIEFYRTEADADEIFALLAIWKLCVEHARELDAIQQKRFPGAKPKETLDEHG